MLRGQLMVSANGPTKTPRKEKAKVREKERAGNSWGGDKDWNSWGDEGSSNDDWNSWGSKDKSGGDSSAYGSPQDMMQMMMMYNMMNGWGAGGGKDASGWGESGDWGTGSNPMMQMMQMMGGK